MSRSSRIKKQLIKSIDSQTKFGQSKHEDKLKAREEARKKGESYKMIKGVYSFKTRDSYVEEAGRFVDWATGKYNCKSKRSSKQYVHNYLKWCKEKELSAWTIHLRAYALACAFKCPVKSFGVELPKRERKNIKRSRLETKSDRQTNDPKYDRIRSFARATGARRAGMQRLRANDIREREKGGYEVHLLEKGGKHRWARVNPNMEAIVKEYFGEARERGEDALLFPKLISNRVDIHACRAQYARDMYAVYDSEGYSNGKKYICRLERYGDVYDKGVLMCVSRDLGHNRCDVVVNHYMK